MRIALNLSLLIVAALSVFAATRSLEEAPDFYAPKLEALAASKQPVNLAYFGSSLIYRGVMPWIVDAELAKQGYEVRSFNMAMLAMRPHEADRYLRVVLASPPPGLRTVVIELSDWTPTIREPNRYTPRPIYWHDAYETRSVLRSAWLLDALFSSRIASASMHVLHFGARAFGLGLIPERFRAWLAGADPEQAQEVSSLVALQGFRPFRADREMGEGAGVNSKAFLDDISGYHAEVARLRAENVEPGDLRHYNVDAVRDQVRIVPAAGLEVIYVIAPGIESYARLRRLHQEGVAPTLFAFNEPHTYPTLYQERNRFDRHHLNSRGAKFFSTLLAGHLAAH